MNNLNDLNILPKELHFHIGLYLSFVEAHYFITSLYRRQDCQGFWKQYLIQRFYINVNNVNEYNIFAYKILCRPFAVHLERLFDKQCYPKINYFDNVLIKYLKEKVLFEGTNTRLIVAISDFDDNIKPIPVLLKQIITLIGQTVYSVVYNDICNNGITKEIDRSTGRRSLQDLLTKSLINNLLVLLKNVEGDSFKSYTDKLCQTTKYFTPNGIVSINFDVDVYFQFDELIGRDVKEDLKGFTLMLNRGLMKNACKKIREYLK